GPERASRRRHAAAVSIVCKPVSTIAHPPPSRTAHRLMWFSVNGIGMRIHSTPGAISRVCAGAGGFPHGYRSDAVDCRGNALVDALMILLACPAITRRYFYGNAAMK